ncbi:MAG: hypothetical protein ACR2IF_03195 [Terriglobales bacterium]
MSAPGSAGQGKLLLDPQYLASILERVARGDPSVTDEVFWLQMHEDFMGSEAREQ